MFGISYLCLALVLGHGSDKTEHDTKDRSSEIIYVEGLRGVGANLVVDVRADGTWSTAKGVEGTLSEAEVARIKAAAEAVVLELGPPMVPCPPAINQPRFVRVAKGEVVWNGCQRPHESVFALIELVDSLTTRRPPPVLIRFQRHHSGQQEATQETFTIERSGAWTSHKARGTLPRAAIDELIKLVDAALIEAAPTPLAPNCKSGFLHLVEVPGRGTARWAPPCSEPSDTLGAAITRAKNLVGWER